MWSKQKRKNSVSSTMILVKRCPKQKKFFSLVIKLYKSKREKTLHIIPIEVENIIKQKKLFSLCVSWKSALHEYDTELLFRVCFPDQKTNTNNKIRSYRKKEKKEGRKMKNDKRKLYLLLSVGVFMCLNNVCVVHSILMIFTSV